MIYDIVFPQAAKVTESSIAATSLAVGRNSTEVSFEGWTFSGDNDATTVVVAVASIDTLGGGTGRQPHTLHKKGNRLGGGITTYGMILRKRCRQQEFLRANAIVAQFLRRDTVIS